MVLKLLIGAYLIFVGVTLLRTIQEVRPSNQEVMSGIASVFILVGSGYLIGLLVSAIKRSMETRNAGNTEEREIPSDARPVRDQSLFRTAPMVLLDAGVPAPRTEGEALQERAERPQVSADNSATVRLQKVGPDTMVWKK